MTIDEAFRLAIQRQDAGHLDEALALYRQILAAQPNHAWAINRVGLLAFAGRRPREAVALFAQAVSLEPTVIEFRNNLGSALAEAGRLDEAITELWKALELGPENLPVLKNLAPVLRVAGQIDESMAVIRRALAMEPDDPDSLAELGRGLYQHGDFEQAVASLRKAIDLLPNSAALHVELGGALIANDQFEEAMTIYQRGASIAGDVATAGGEVKEGGKIFAVCSIRNGPADLLPHWLEHYSRLGVDELLIGVFEDVEGETRREIDRCADRWRFQRFSQKWEGVREEGQQDQRKAACRAAGAVDESWIMHTDLDELIELPAPPREIVTAAEKQGQKAIYGWMVDRVASDGSMPPIRSESALWQQYPVGCRLTAAVVRGSTQKVVLAKLNVILDAGHHFAKGRWAGRVPMGRPEEYLVHHFKWHGDVVPRMQWSLSQPNTHRLWAVESRRFLKWLDDNGGRINLAEPALKARNLCP